jgi:hypothetical protein
MEKRKMIERGRLKDKWGTRYFIEIDEAGTRHNYVFGLGFFGEIDEQTGEFDLIDFTSPSLMKELPAAFKEEWPDYEWFEESS